jgi:hypothetical protein
MSPAELDLLIQGAFIYQAPDGSRYATWSDMSKFGVKPVGRSGKLSADDLQTPASEVLARINAALAA